MAKFIRKAVIATAVAGAVAAYLKKKTENKNEIDVTELNKPEGNTVPEVSIPQELEKVSVEVIEYDDILNEPEESLLSSDPVAEPVEIVLKPVLPEVEKAVEDIEEAVEQSSLEVPVEFHEPEQEIIVEAEEEKDSPAEVEEKVVVDHDVYEQIEEIVNGVVTADIPELEEVLTEDFAEVYDEEIPTPVIPDIFGEIQPEEPSLENDIDSIIDTVIDQTMKLNIVDDIDEELEQLTQDVIDLSNDPVEEDVSIPFDSEEYGDEEFDDLLEEEIQIKKILNEDTQALIDEIHNAVAEETEETIEGVEEKYLAVELEDTIMDLKAVSENDIKLDFGNPEGRLEAMFPHLSERRIEAITTQISTMLEALGDSEHLNLKHFVVFSDPADYADYKAVAENLGYQVSDLNENNETHLLKSTKSERETLLHEILTLADTIKAYNGNYRGWKVIENEESQN